MLPELRGGKPTGEQPEKDEHAEEGPHARVGEPQGGDGLSGDLLRPLHPGERGLAARAVVAASLDVEETSVCHRRHRFPPGFVYGSAIAPRSPTRFHEHAGPH